MSAAEAPLCSISSWWPELTETLSSVAEICVQLLCVVIPSVAATATAHGSTSQLKALPHVCQNEEFT